MIDPDLVEVEVLRTSWTTPNYICVTFGGPGIGTFPKRGFDQFCRLFFPAPGRELILPPTAPEGWWPSLNAMPEAARPLVRNYTVRHHDPDACELAIEFVLHEGPSPASDWARSCRPGDRAGLRAEGTRYQPPGPGRQLIVADETGVPAALGVLDSIDGDLEADVFLQVPYDKDIRALNVPSSVRVQWSTREAHVGMADAVRAAQVPTQLPAYAFVIGENKMVTTIRRHLVRCWGMDRAAVEFVGYWSRGA